MGPLALAAIAAVPALFKTVAGAIQAGKGKRELKNLKRPEYFIPQEVKQASRLAENQYLQKGLPGQELMENRAMGVTARGINDAKAVSSSSGDALDAVTKLYAGEQDQLRNIGLAAAQQDLQDAAAYRQQLGIDADYAEKKWDMNVFQPYLMKYGEAKAKIAAGNMNVSSGLDNLSQIGTSLVKPPAPTTAATLPETNTYGRISDTRYSSYDPNSPIGSVWGGRMGSTNQPTYNPANPFSSNMPAPPKFGTSRKLVFDWKDPLQISWQSDQ